MSQNKKKLIVALSLAMNQQVVYAQFDSEFELSSVNGVNGIKIIGEATLDYSGWSVSKAGDFNGDGIDDLVIGAKYADPNGNSIAGSSYVVFGKNTGFTNPIELSAINGINGIKINGEAPGDKSGWSVSAAGDVNGDGIDDLIIGARGADPEGISNAGSSYIIFGSDTGFTHPFNLSTLDGLNGFKIIGQAANDIFGNSVSTAGDVNGDGIDDVIIGAPYADPNGNNYSGSIYVILGSDSGFPNPFNLSILNGLNGFKINSEAEDEQSGFSVSDAGDVNGDGIDDIIIGAKGAHPNEIRDSGSSYIVFGSNTGFANPLQLSNINGSNGIRINGEMQHDHSGISVSAAGDVNGDGIDDVIIGAYHADPNGQNYAGSSYVVFGSDSALPNPFNLSTINGSNGIKINGEAETDISGYSVSAAGDVNGDGTDDIIIGAPWASNNIYSAIGKSYVVFGSDSALPNPFNLSTINGSNGFKINGEMHIGRSGWSVSAAGDISGDGIDDVIIGAPWVYTGGTTYAGSSYVLFGREKPLFKDGFE